MRKVFGEDGCEGLPTCVLLGVSCGRVKCNRKSGGEVGQVDVDSPRLASAQDSYLRKPLGPLIEHSLATGTTVPSLSFPTAPRADRAAIPLVL